jgi:hypothetical protein
MTRRLIDLPGLKALEHKALMNPRYAEPDARGQYPDIDQCSISVFGLTADAADATPRPADWDAVELKPIAQQVEAFEREGWDVTDDRRRPLRMLSHFNVQLWLALRGVAGALPFAPVDDEAPSRWAASLQADATKFKRDRR